MRAINTNEQRIKRIIKEAQDLIIKHLQDHFIGDIEITKRTKKFIEKIWRLNEAEEPKDAPKIKLGEFNGL